MELRERVAEKIDEWIGDISTSQAMADAAIAAVLDAMQEPSEDALAAVVNEPTHLYGQDGRGAEYERDMKNAVAVERLMKRQDWQAMLAAFRREALGEG